MLWTLAHTEKRATESYADWTEAVTVERYTDEALQRVQEIANEVIVEVSCESPSAGAVYLSMMEYLADYAQWREASAPFDLGRTPDGPSIEELRACVEG
jgi:TRAP-type mannitol/chloroaromatic compound transport system substrate-binding protein